MPEDSWLLKLIEPRSIGFFIFAASIFAIEFNEMWAVDVPRTVALSKFDILSSSIANIPVLIISILAAGLMIAAATMLVLIGWGGLGAGFSLCLMVVLGVGDFVVSTSRWAFGTLRALITKDASENIPEPSFGLLRLLKTERFKEASATFWASVNSARGGARKAWSIVSHRPRRGSWEQVAQIFVTLTVFLVIWTFSWFSADHYRKQIYDFSLSEERGSCGPQTAPAFLSLGYIFEFFQPLNAGFLVLNKDFTARSTLIKQVSGTVIESPEGSDKTPSVVVTGCVTYVGDYGEWAFLVPRHKAPKKGETGGFLIRRSIIQEFTSIAPAGSNPPTSGGVEFVKPEEVLASLTKEVADLRKAVNDKAQGILPLQSGAETYELAKLRAAVSNLEAQVNSPEGIANPRLEQLIAENGEAIAHLKADIAALAMRLEVETASSDRLQALEVATGRLGETVQGLSVTFNQLSGDVAGLGARTEANGDRMDTQSDTFIALSHGVGTLSAKLDGAEDAIGSLGSDIARAEAALTQTLKTGLQGQQTAIDGLEADLADLSDKVKRLAGQSASPPSDGALTALKTEVAVVAEALAALSVIVTPLQSRIEGLADEVVTLRKAEDLEALIRSIAELRAEMAAIKAMIPGLQDPQRRDVLIRLIEQMDARLANVEDGPAVIVINGSGKGAPFSFDDQHAGIPTRLVDAIDQVKGLGGHLSECYKTGKRTDHVNFARNEIQLNDGPKTAALLKKVAGELDLPNRDASSLAKLVFLKGGADSLGTPEVNRRISEQRAAAVQRAIEDYLGEKLIGKNVEIVSVGIGENVAILDPDGSIGARAVEVIICDAAAN